MNYGSNLDRFLSDSLTIWIMALILISFFQTRVLVTNSITFLPKVDDIIVIKEGMISEQGSYEELLSHHGPFAEFIKTYLNEEQSDEEDEEGR